MIATILDALASGGVLLLAAFGWLIACLVCVVVLLALATWAACVRAGRVDDESDKLLLSMLEARRQEGEE